LENENFSYEQKHTELSDSLIVIEEAIKLMNNLVHGKETIAYSGGRKAFIQLSNKFGGMQSLLEKHVRKSVTAFLKPVV